MRPQLIKHFYQCEDYFFKSVSKEWFALNDHALIYVTNVPVASLNLVVLQKDIANPHDFFEQCDHFFAAKNLPWAAVLSTHYLKHDLEDYLQGINFEASENATAMFIDLHALSPFVPNEKFVIKSTDNKLNDWMSPLIDAFNSTNELTSLYLQTHERARTKKAQLRHLTFYIDDQPISSLTLSFHNNLARIDDFGTLSAYQGKGYGRYLLNYTLKEAKKAGVEFCFLEAAETSLSLYEKMGFKNLFKRKYLWDFTL
ncbi:GNAT family N-acetyltransferase [Legionella cardiaca]|uniref:GNAT family N-acetyltransferase n=1 Tax=Legionella cardiaca TaxID=1071983 RepID=A0ABY8AUU6_9GAMM|nr:GNAT family N-acetyltransferase [Legionella cardiaca]WED43931.1 GNAT family N-acetyltransferase [Legionella cardiaca]